MTRTISRRAFVKLGSLSLVGVGGCISGPGAGSQRGTPDDSMDTPTPSGSMNELWRTTTLTDIRTDTEFTISEFTDRTVLLETFAVWCPTCLRQQQELEELHQILGDDVVSISLNIDPNENAQRVRNHIEEHGFDWRFAVSPPDVTQALVDQFGSSIANPPSAPVVLVCADDARLLQYGVKSPNTLQSAIEDGC